MSRGLKIVLPTAIVPFGLLGAEALVGLGPRSQVELGEGPVGRNRIGQFELAPAEERP